MAKPMIHAKSSARKWGGKPEDYLPIHQHMDSTKGAAADNRHRFVTHNAWYISPEGPLELIFGVEFTNSAGRAVQVRDIGEQHILEDFGGYIPTLQDYVMAMEVQPWMNGMGYPPSAEKLALQRIETLHRSFTRD